MSTYPMTGKLANLFDDASLSGGLSYFDYEIAIARQILIPWLKRHMTLSGLSVGDFGCHQGGVLEGLRRFGGIAQGVGYDLDEPSIQNSPFRPDENFRLAVWDVTLLNPDEHRFDLILIRDVLEHIPNHVAVLKNARACLNPGGRIFVSFPPWLSPFGGHQQEASNWVRFLPYVHYLPRPLYLKLIQTKDTPYMSAESSMADVRSVAGTRMTLAKAEKAFRESGLEIKVQERFLLRPEFKIRYGIPTCGNSPLCRLPVLGEIFTMGVYYLLG